MCKAGEFDYSWGIKQSKVFGRRTWLNSVCAGESFNIRAYFYLSQKSQIQWELYKSYN